MIRFLVGVTEFFVCLCCIVIFASLFLISLAFLDYVYDTDLKNKLCTLIHKPAFLGTLRKHVTEKIEDIDSNARKEDEQAETYTHIHKESPKMDIPGGYAYYYPSTGIPRGALEPVQFKVKENKKEEENV